MKRRFALLLLPICLGPVIDAQEKAPEVLREAAQCLVSKAFLKANALDLGYKIDTDSWPGEEVLYVVAFPGRSRTKGYAFTIFLEQKDHHQVFDVQNNARFAKTRSSAKSEYNGLDFPGPPLGGVWTQEHLAKAINQIRSQPTFSVTASDLELPSPSAGCQSYTDPK